MKKDSNISKQSNKGLQRFTKPEDEKTIIDRFKTVEDFENFKKEGDAVLFNKVRDRIVDYLNKAINSNSGEQEKYFRKLEKWVKADEQGEESLLSVRRLEWQINSNKIKKHTIESLKNYNRLPTHNELEDLTGLSRTTISKHIKEGTSSEFYKEELMEYKLLTTQVLNHLFKIGTSQSNVKALKVYLDYFKESSGGVKNYIQINNTRIDEVTVNQLPQDARLQIESIINQYQPI